LVCVRDAIFGHVPYRCPICEEEHNLAIDTDPSEFHRNSSVTIECPHCSESFTYWWPFPEKMYHANH
jgi:transcriptional regulator NrdR family protein